MKNLWYQPSLDVLACLLDYNLVKIYGYKSFCGSKRFGKDNRSKIHASQLVAQVLQLQVGLYLYLAILVMNICITT